MSDLCTLHPDEHREACGNEVERASAKAMREHEARHPECKAGCSISGWVDMPACPVCTNDAVEKAYDRKARLAENAEEIFWLVQRAETIRRNAHSKAWSAAEVTRSWHDWTERAAVVTEKIESPEGEEK